MPSGRYSVGHPATSTKAVYLAAVLACGEGARISGMAAAHLLGLIPGPPPPPEVSAPGEHRARGVITHRSRLTGSRHTTLADRIPASRPAVALVEVAARLDDVALSRAIHQAIVRRIDEQSMRVALADRPNSPGRRRLATIFFGDDRMLLSELERGFLELVRGAGLPLPVTNGRTDGRYVDCRWPDRGVTVELLGFRFHNSRATWEQDHARRREARDRCDHFRAFTYEDVTAHAEATLAELALLLNGHSGPGLAEHVRGRNASLGWPPPAG